MVKFLMTPSTQHMGDMMFNFNCDVNITVETHKNIYNEYQNHAYKPDFL